MLTAQVCSSLVVDFQAVPKVLPPFRNDSTNLCWGMLLCKHGDPCSVQAAWDRSSKREGASSACWSVSVAGKRTGLTASPCWPRVALFGRRRLDAPPPPGAPAPRSLRNRSALLSRRGRSAQEPCRRKEPRVPSPALEPLLPQVRRAFVVAIVLRLSVRLASSLAFGVCCGQ